MKQIVLDLNECGTFIVNLDKDGKGGSCTSNQHNLSKDTFDNEQEENEYEAQIDALESLVLAHAIAGVDITSEAYKEGLKTTLQAIGNQ